MCPLCPPLCSDADLRRRQLRQADAAIFPPLPTGKPPALDEQPDASYYGEGEDEYRCKGFLPSIFDHLEYTAALLEAGCIFALMANVAQLALKSPVLHAP